MRCESLEKRHETHLKSKGKTSLTNQGIIFGLGMGGGGIPVQIARMITGRGHSLEDDFMHKIRVREEKVGEDEIGI